MREAQPNIVIGFRLAISLGSWAPVGWPPTPQRHPKDAATRRLAPHNASWCLAGPFRWTPGTEKPPQTRGHELHFGIQGPSRVCRSRPTQNTRSAAAPRDPLPTPLLLEHSFPRHKKLAGHVRLHTRGELSKHKDLARDLRLHTEGWVLEHPIDSQRGRSRSAATPPGESPPPPLQIPL